MKAARQAPAPSRSRRLRPETLNRPAARNRPEAVKQCQRHALAQLRDLAEYYDNLLNLAAL